MKKVKLSITDESNITYGMANDKNDDSIIIVSINKPYGVTASSTEINDVLNDTYLHVVGTASTGIEGSVTYALLQEDLTRVNYKCI
tara:strand:+ start:30909 stop:31166 length:258 start_codon:yes stop_codon:yes gene_type:complete